MATRTLINEDTLASTSGVDTVSIHQRNPLDPSRTHLVILTIAELEQILAAAKA